MLTMCDRPTFFEKREIGGKGVGSVGDINSMLE